MHKKSDLHGKHTISKFKDEDAYYVKGIHQPLITPSLFNLVQDVLDVKLLPKIIFPSGAFYYVRDVIAHCAVTHLRDVKTIITIIIAVLNVVVV